MCNKIYTLVFSLLLVLTVKTTSAQTYQWSKGFGSTGQERVMDLVTDNIGNVYTVGTFSLSADFDPGTANYLLTSTGLTDIFVSALDMNGDFLWAHKFGDSFSDYAHSIVIDRSGNVIITGTFRDTVDFDPGPGVAQEIANGFNDLFILKLDALGNFVWVKNCALLTSLYESCVTTDSSGNIYLAGEYTMGADFDPGPATFFMTPVGANDVYVLKLDAQGNFLWAKSLGGGSFDRCRSVSLDSAGNVYTAGSFRFQADFDPGPGVFNLDAQQSDDIFISKLDSAGNFIWVKNWDSGYCWAMTVDSIGNIYTTGVYADSSDFDPGPGVYTLASSGYQDIYISKLDVNGNFVWARSLSGPDYQEAHTICVGHNGNVYSAGRFVGNVDFDPGPGIFNLTAPFNGIDYLSVLDGSGNFLNAIAIGGVWAGMGGAGETVSVDSEDNLFLTGTFINTVDFNPPFGANMISNGGYDVFIIKYGDENVGIHENQTGNGITVYPNPGNGNYFVEFESSLTGTLTVTNLLGQEIINAKLVSATSYQLNLETADGIYFLRIFEKDQCHVVKLIKD